MEWIQRFGIFCHIQSGVEIGKQCILGQNVNISNNVCIGNNVKIQNNVSVYEGICIEDYVFCGPSMVFTNDLTPRSKYPKGVGEFKKTLVKTGASIGANATIVCGNTIGTWSMIAAGAVVTRDVEDYSLVAGLPARHMGWVCECGSLINDKLICEKCQRTYVLTDGKLSQNANCVRE